jgi:hypothetical protein
MPVDESDSTASTAELAPPDAVRVHRDDRIFSGRAGPVVLSDLQLALIDEADDLAYGEWLGPANGAETAPGTDDRRTSLASFAARGAVVVILAIPALLIMALAIAVATR